MQLPPPPISPSRLFSLHWRIVFYFVLKPVFPQCRSYDMTLDWFFFLLVLSLNSYPAFVPGTRETAPFHTLLFICKYLEEQCEWVPLKILFYCLSSSSIPFLFMYILKLYYTFFWYI